ncbi:hypothetical protein BH10ACT1_BH10ACT1_05870 [soil metagenome]
MTRPSLGSGGRRALVRWSWRLFRRDWRQHALLLTLISVAVAIAVAGSTMATNAASRSWGRFGDAAALTRVDAADPDAAQDAVDDARQRFGPLEVIAHGAASVPGSAASLDVRSQDPVGRYGHRMLALRSGRYPTSTAEVALTARAMDLLSTGIGSRLALGGHVRTVVGRVENPGDLADDFALLAPGRRAGADSLTLLLSDSHLDGGGGGRAAAASGSPNLGIERPGSDRAAVRATVLVATTLTMALVGLISAAGFLVLAQRRQRQLGLLAAIGASERQVRLVVLAGGAIVGLASSAIGVALGLLGWLAAAPIIEEAVGHRVDRWALPWGLIAAALGLAIGAAIMAAWWPARAAARLSIMGALSRRPAPPTPVHRSILVASALVTGGLAAITVSRPETEQVQPLLLVLGLLAVVIGVVLASPSAIRLLARPAAQLPFPVRLALRDLVRHQARAAAALAAITLALSISVGVVVLAKANEPRSGEGNLSNRELLVRIGDQRTGPDATLTPAELRRRDEAAQGVAAAAGDPHPVALDVAVNPPGADPSVPDDPIGLVLPISHGERLVGYPYVATAAVLRDVGIDPASVASDTELLTVRTDDVRLGDPAVRPIEGGTKTRVQHVDLPPYSSAPSSLVTETALRRHGWVAARAGWLVESDQPLTGAQVAAARRAAAAVGLEVEVRSGADGMATLQTVATAVGTVLALAIMAMTIGLIRGEAAADLRTLTATGASSRTRRTVTAATAGALALLAVALAVAGAYLALGAAFRTDLGELVPLPVYQLLVLAVGLPVVATTGGWLLAGREPATFSQQSPD